MTTLPPSLIEQSIWMIKELGIDVDKPTANDYGRMNACLYMLKMNSVPLRDFPIKWKMLLENAMYPEDRDFPHDLFLISQKENTNYKLLLAAIDDIYQKYGE